MSKWLNVLSKFFNRPVVILYYDIVIFLEHNVDKYVGGSLIIDLLAQSA